jgi:hypothetical protein
MNQCRTTVLERRKAVAERYLRHENQWEIANALAISQSTVSRDLNALRAEWLVSKDVAIDQIIARELAKIDHLERTHWDAWGRSCTKKETISGKRVTLGKKTREETSKREEYRDGKPEFLRGVERCIRRRGEILGIIQNRPEANRSDASNLPTSVIVVEDANWFGQPRLGPPGPANGTPAPDAA